MKKKINKVKNGTIQEWYQKNQNMWRFKIITRFMSISLILGICWLYVNYHSNQIQIEENNHNVADSNTFSYGMRMASESLIVENYNDSKIGIMTDESRKKNAGISCILYLYLSNSLWDYHIYNSRIDKMILKGEKKQISLVEIMTWFRINTIYKQTLTWEIECNKNDINLSAMCWNNCLDENIQWSWNLKILLIDRSNNQWESLYYAKGKKKIIRHIRQWFSWSNTLIKTMNSASVSSNENVIFVNISKHSLTWDIVNDVVKIIEKTASEYNNLPVVVKPMSKFDYKSMKYYYVNTVKLPYGILPKFINLKEDVNEYDTRFLDYPENFELDFWIVLHQQ